MDEFSKVEYFVPEREPLAGLMYFKNRFSNVIIDQLRSTHFLTNMRKLISAKNFLPDLFKSNLQIKNQMAKYNMLRVKYTGSG
jgi:hypothetical protein